MCRQTQVAGEEGLPPRRSAVIHALSEFFEGIRSSEEKNVDVQWFAEYFSRYA